MSSTSSQIDPEEGHVTAPIHEEEMEDRSGNIGSMKQTIMQYTDLCNQIRVTKQDVKILSDRKKEIEAELCNYMISNNIDVLNTSGGKISLYNTKKVQPLNKEFLCNAIKSRIPDTNVAEDITTLAFSSRPVREERKVKHTPVSG